MIIIASATQVLLMQRMQADNTLPTDTYGRQCILCMRCYCFAMQLQTDVNKARLCQQGAAAAAAEGSLVLATRPTLASSATGVAPLTRAVLEGRCLPHQLR
jgi:hypothetical protein